MKLPFFLLSSVPVNPLGDRSDQTKHPPHQFHRGRSGRTPADCGFYWAEKMCSPVPHRMAITLYSDTALTSQFSHSTENQKGISRSVLETDPSMGSTLLTLPKLFFKINSKQDSTKCSVTNSYWRSCRLGKTCTAAKTENSHGILISRVCSHKIWPSSAFLFK